MCSFLPVPIYWFGVNAQLKLLLDRTFALVKFDPKTGEPLEHKTSNQNTLCVIATGGGPLNAGLKQVDETFKAAAKFMKCRYRSLLVPNAPTDPVELGKNTTIKQKALCAWQKSLRRSEMLLSSKCRYYGVHKDKRGNNVGEKYCSAPLIAAFFSTCVLCSCTPLIRRKI